MMQHSEWDSAPQQQQSPYDRPGSPADWVLLGAAIAATLPFLFANAVIVAYRRRAYFKAQGGVDLILGISVSGLIWVASSFVVNQHFPRDRGILKVCAFWSFWIHLAFGFCLWLVCLTMRLHRMQTLSDEGADYERRSQKLAWTVLIPLFMTPALAFCIVATVRHITRYSGRSCQYWSHSWSLAEFLSIPPLYISVVLFFLYKLRGKNDFMLITEYRHTCEFVGMALIIYLLSGVLYLTNSQNRASGRCFLTFCVCSLVFFDFWLHMGWAVFLCLFKSESEMDNFEERSGVRILFTLASMRTRGIPSFNIPSSEGAMLEAVSKAIEDVASYKDRKEELEKEKIELLAKIHELRKELGFPTNLL